MPNTRSAAKRSRQTSQRTLRNKSKVSAVRTQQRQVRDAVTKGDKQAAASALQTLAAQLDKAAKTGALHPNAAARRKGKFAKAVANIG